MYYITSYHSISHHEDFDDMMIKYDVILKEIFPVMDLAVSCVFVVDANSNYNQLQWQQQQVVHREQMMMRLSVVKLSVYYPGCM